MTDSKNDTNLSIAWEQNTFAPNRPVAVEVTFTAPTIDEHSAPRLPLNVGLSIDRSGSMAGEKLAAARQAAIGVAESMKDREHLAAVAFDNTVIDIAPSLALDDAVRARIASRIRQIESGGSTALFDGFARAAELVASGTKPDESDSWVIVLSDGMGNHGLTDPASMRVHASALVDRGIRTITVGIGEDYQAAQLTALSDGGAGEFHHASNADEIVEIVLVELKSLRVTAVRDLRLIACAQHKRWRLLGGEQYQNGDRRDLRFDRVSSGRTVRAIALFWPTGNDRVPDVTIEASWVDRDGVSHGRAVTSATQTPPDRRDVDSSESPGTERKGRSPESRVVRAAGEAGFHRVCRGTPRRRGPRRLAPPARASRGERVAHAVASRGVRHGAEIDDGARRPALGEAGRLYGCAPDRQEVTMAW
jgi:Mg-chelatase subunit ChlD